MITLLSERTLSESNEKYEIGKSGPGKSRQICSKLIRIKHDLPCVIHVEKSDNMVASIYCRLVLIFAAKFQLRQRERV